MISRKCKNCNKTFNTWLSWLKRSKNSGTFCSRKCRGIYDYPNKKAFIKKNKEIVSNQRGENNNQWKGVGAGYKAKHTYIQRKHGSPTYCEQCGDEKAKRYEWANISGNYTRNRKDYMRMCKSCHNRLDRGKEDFPFAA